MSRRNARKNAFYLVFQSDFMGFENVEETKEVFYAVNEEIEEEDKVFINALTDGVCEKREEIDAIIEKRAKGWSVERMNKADLAILRIAVYEMKFMNETPVKVVINEAIEFAKKYCSDESPAFVNGILGSIAEEA